MRQLSAFGKRYPRVGGFARRSAPGDAGSRTIYTDLEMPLRTRLFLNAFSGLLLTGAMLFAPAGTWRYWQGWTFWAVSTGFILFTFPYFYKHDPKLLARRLQRKEKIPEQKRLMRGFQVGFFAIFLLPGFDRRLGWSRRLVGAVPPWLSLVSIALILGGLVLLFWVMKVNSFASRTIQVEAGQTVISSGPYAFVRHPLYVADILVWMAMPIALASWVAWPPTFALVVPVFVYRLLNEEEFLRRELPGYREYCLRTRFRLVPYVW